MDCEQPPAASSAGRAQQDEACPYQRGEKQFCDTQSRMSLLSTVLSSVGTVSSLSSFDILKAVRNKVTVFDIVVTQHTRQS